MYKINKQHGYIAQQKKERERERKNEQIDSFLASYIKTKNLY